MCAPAGKDLAHNSMIDYLEWISNDPNRHAAFKTSLDDYIRQLNDHPERTRVKDAAELRRKSVLETQNKTGHRTHND